jgi:hypothetical protein
LAGAAWPAIASTGRNLVDDALLLVSEVRRDVVGAIVLADRLQFVHEVRPLEKLAALRET